MKMVPQGTAHGSMPATAVEREVDMAAVLQTVYESAHMRSPSCTHAAVAALAECVLSFAQQILFVDCMHVLRVKSRRLLPVACIASCQQLNGYSLSLGSKQRMNFE
jgi:hypothetical protein